VGFAEHPLSEVHAGEDVFRYVGVEPVSAVPVGQDGSEPDRVEIHDVVYMTRVPESGIEVFEQGVTEGIAAVVGEDGEHVHGRLPPARRGRRRTGSTLEAIPAWPGGNDP
jgi:hypothetical protein